jgi:hypothetical protein
MSETPEGESLFDQYLVVKKLLDDVASGAPTKDLDKALEALVRFDKSLEASDTFSPNEIVDDVSTTSLRYVGVAYMLGDLLLSMPTPGYEKRGETVKAAKLALKRFLDRCEALLIMNEQSKKELDGKSSTDALALRSAKIERFRREQAMRGKMRALEEKLTARRAKLSATNEVEAAVEADSESSEVERELVLLQLESMIDRAIVHLGFIAQEETMLEQAGKEATEDKERASMGLPPRDRGPGSMPGLTPHGPPRPNPAGAGAAAAAAAAASSAAAPEPPRPLRVHKIGDRDDAKGPIPDHMRDYMKHVQAPPEGSAASGHTHGPGAGGPPRGAGPGADGDDPFNKPWFRPTAQACPHCGDDDVTQRPQYTKYMMQKVVGGRGKLVPACPIHGNAHPAGECPGLQAGRGGAFAGAAGYPDPINQMVRFFPILKLSLRLYP